MDSDITVIILLFKTPKNLVNNLKAYKKFNLIILDQSNDLIMKKKLSKIFPKIENYILSKENKGFAKGINFLVKKVKTKYFFCTQADVMINYNSIIELKKTLLRNYKRAIVSIPKLHNKKNKKNVKDVAVKNMTGATFFCEKKKFFEVGMFDEDFFFYWEDVEFSKRISRLNFKIYENQNAIALHYGSNSSVNDFSTEFIRYKNFIYGELLYDLKSNKIRFIKIIRKLIQNLFFLILNLISFRLRNLNKNIAKLTGILKFTQYLLKKKF